MEFAFGIPVFANPGQTITPGNAKLHTPTTMALGAPLKTWVTTLCGFPTI